MIIAGIFLAIIATTCAFRVGVSLRPESELNDGGGYKFYFGDTDTAEFPFMGDYSDYSGSKSPISVNLADDMFEFDEGGHRVGGVVKFSAFNLPACRNITFAVTAYHGNATSVPEYPCQSTDKGREQKCLESAPSETAYAWGSSPENLDCSYPLRTSADADVVVTCKFREGLYGGTAAPWWKMLYASHDVAVNVSSTEFDGSDAVEGASPLFMEGEHFADEVVSMKLTFPSTTYGRKCFHLKASCHDDIDLATEELAKEMTGNATCIDIMEFGSTVPEEKPFEPESSCKPGLVLCPCDEMQIIPKACVDGAVCRGDPKICVEEQCFGSFGCQCNSDLTCDDGSKCAVHQGGLSLCVKPLDVVDSATASVVLSALSMLVAAVVSLA